MQITSTKDGIFELVGHLNQSDVDSLLSQFVALTFEYKGKSLAIDLGKLETVNSVVLSILLNGIRSAKKNGCQLSFQNASEYLFNIARVGGVESMLFSAE